MSTPAQKLIADRITWMTALHHARFKKDRKLAERIEGILADIDKRIRAVPAKEIYGNG